MPPFSVRILNKVQVIISTHYDPGQQCINAAQAVSDLITVTIPNVECL